MSSSRRKEWVNLSGRKKGGGTVVFWPCHQCREMSVWGRGEGDQWVEVTDRVHGLGWAPVTCTALANALTVP